jgi:hypothetical protein
MKKFWDQLKPQERRWVTIVGIIVFLVLNYIFVWPRFKDWGANTRRIDDDRRKIAMYQAEIARQAEYKKKIAGFDSENQDIQEGDQALHFEEAFRDRALENGVSILSVSRPNIRSDDYTMEQSVTLQLNASEKNLVDFLYSLGSGGSTIRAKSISMRPLDNNRYQLHADLTISESYLRNPTKPTPRTGAVSAATGPAKPAPGPAKPAVTPANSAPGRGPANIPKPNP